MEWRLARSTRRETVPPVGKARGTARLPLEARLREAGLQVANVPDARKLGCQRKMRAHVCTRLKTILKKVHMAASGRGEPPLRAQRLRARRGARVGVGGVRSQRGGGAPRGGDGQQHRGVLVRRGERSARGALLRRRRERRAAIATAVATSAVATTVTTAAFTASAVTPPVASSLWPPPR